MTAPVDARRPLPAAAAVAELARAALVRVGRGKALWVVAAIAALPAIMAMVLARASRELDERTWEAVFVTTRYVLVVIPPVLVASAVADELEDRTAAYLWSRALPRWTIIAGKLVGLAPLCALLMAGALGAAYVAGGLGVVVTGGQLVRGVVGLGAAAMAGAAVAAAIATLVPRHAVAVTVAWMMLVDSNLAWLDVRLHHVSTIFGARAIAGFGGDAGALAGALTLVGLTAVATSVACWRIGRIE